MVDIFFSGEKVCPWTKCQMSRADILKCTVNISFLVLQLSNQLIIPYLWFKRSQFCNKEHNGNTTANPILTLPWYNFLQRRRPPARKAGGGKVCLSRAHSPLSTISTSPCFLCVGFRGWHFLLFQAVIPLQSIRGGQAGARQSVIAPGLGQDT